MVTFERATGAALDKSETRAVKNGRYGATQETVDLGGLRKIGDFGGAAEIGDGRQKVILHDAAQCDVGAEAPRLARRPGGQFFRRVFRFSTP